jgi:hypothetical protein
MKRLSLYGVPLLTALCFVTAGIACASNLPNITVPFPGAGDAYCSFTNGCGTIPPGGQTAYMSTAGDYVTTTVITYQMFQEAMGFWIFQDYLGGGNTEQVDLLVNGLFVGSFVAQDCGYCGSYFTIGFLFFSQITCNGPCVLSLVLQNTIPDGGGSIAFADGGQTILAQEGVPELSSLVLFGSGLLGVAGVVRRKLKV